MESFEEGSSAIKTFLDYGNGGSKWEQKGSSQPADRKGVTKYELNNKSKLCKFELRVRNGMVLWKGLIIWQI